MLILASKSKTRQALLKNAGLSFITAVSEIDEREIEKSLAISHASKADVATTLSIAKAQAVSAAVSMEFPNALVIGADQTLEFENIDIHKPASLSAAVDQLFLMSGKTHYLHSGVALVRNGEVLWSGVETASLHIKPLTHSEIESIISLEGEAILSSVGGYRLEGPSVRLFETISGDYFTILGLPLLPLLSALQSIAPELLS